MLRILKYALLTGLVTLVMGVVASFVFPVEVDLESIGIAQPPKVERKPYYTKEEMDQADREGEELLRQVKKKLNEQKRSAYFRQERLAGWWLTWIPWLILPFVLSRRPIWIEAIAIAIPCLGTFVGLLHPYELACITVAFFTGQLLKYLLYRDVRKSEV